MNRKRFSITVSIVASLSFSGAVLADHEPDIVSDIDGTGFGVQAGTYVHTDSPGADHPWYTFNAAAGTEINIDLMTDFPQGSYLWLYYVAGCDQAEPGDVPDVLGGTDLILVAESSNNDTDQFMNQSITHTAAQSGQYIVQVDSWLGGDGDYELTIAPSCGCTDLVFVVDDTGSMDGAISDVQAGLSQIINVADLASGGDVRFGVVSFKDAPETDLDLTFNQTDTMNAISALVASGGSGTPEASDEALNLVINGSNNCNAETFSPFRTDCVKIAILVTDAPPGGCDDSFSGADTAAAMQRAFDASAAGIQLSSIYVPTFGVDTAVADIMMDYASITGGAYTLTAANGSGTCTAIEEVIGNCGGGITDCNNNDIDDQCEIDNGLVDDCNGNGIPDECEWVDCNNNGVLDECDVASGTSIDCNDNGVPDECEPGSLIGRPDPEGSTDRVLRGFVVAFAVDNLSQQISWNHLSGTGTVVDYRGASSWQYEAWASGAKSTPLGDIVGTPGVINLDGVDFAAPYAELRGQFYATGSTALSSATGGAILSTQTDMTLHPVDMDLTANSGGPVSTYAEYFVWNQNETKFSEAFRCVECWDQALVSFIQPNHFALGTLQTDTGYFRINGEANPQCDGMNPVSETALLGLRNTIATSDVHRYQSGVNLFGAGTEPATILYDPLELPDEIAGAQQPKQPHRRPGTQASGVERGVPDIMDRMAAGEKGSVLIFSNVEIRWDEDGNLVQDTFLQITNDINDDVRVQMFFVNGDPPVEGDCFEPGWNWVDNEITLTGNQPAFWSAATGRPGPSLSPVSPFTILDPVSILFP